MATQKQIPILKDLLALQTHTIPDVSHFLLRKQNFNFTKKQMKEVNCLVLIRLAYLVILVKIIYFQQFKENPRYLMDHV